MGANKLAKYVGEHLPKDHKLNGAVSISQVYDGFEGISHIKKAPFYDKHLLKKLVDVANRNTHVITPKLSKTLEELIPV
jgi:predicted alpha/beta-fold hydrolase